MGGPSWHDAERVRNASSEGCGSAHSYGTWTDWQQEKHDWCHEMTCVFLLIVERVNWIASAPECVSSWVLVKLLRNHLLLCWCCVWCTDAYGVIVGPLCGSAVVSAAPWKPFGNCQCVVLYCSILFALLKRLVCSLLPLSRLCEPLLHCWNVQLRARQTGSASPASCQSHIFI